LIARHNKTAPFKKGAVLLFLFGMFCEEHIFYVLDGECSDFSFVSRLESHHSCLYILVTNNDGVRNSCCFCIADFLAETIIIGDKDMAVNKVTLESRDKGQIGQLDTKEVVDRLVEEIKNRS
jgi:hypothetical protein